MGLRSDMTMIELRSRLAESGFHPASYHVGDNWSGQADAVCLINSGYAFEICYVERGQKSQVLSYFTDEAEACEAYFKHVSSNQAGYKL